MRPSIHWLRLPAGRRLAIAPRPRAGDWLADEIAGWKVEGVDVAVSLLEHREIAELELLQMPGVCRAAGIAFVSFPIPDRGVPASIRETALLVQRISHAITRGKAVAIHCRAGIGRSSLLAACVLVHNGCDAARAFAAIAEARGMEVPDTCAQRDWVSAFLAATRG